MMQSGSLRFGASAILLFLLSACGSGSAPAGSAPVALGPSLSASFNPGPIVYAVEATVPVGEPGGVESVAFTVHTRPGGLSEDVHVTYARSYLERTGAIDAASGTLRFPVFGLYAAYAHDVTIEVVFRDAPPRLAEFAVVTDAPAGKKGPPVVSVQSAAPGLDLSFMMLQSHYAAAVIDVDGAVRWQAPDVGGLVFPRACVPTGLVMGGIDTNAIYRVDWLGRVESDVLSDPRYTNSHHNIERGKSGLFDNVAFKDADVVRRTSELVEMTESGAVLRAWNFDRIFTDVIEAHGEDPSTLVKNDFNWFHMNSAIYDAKDDSIIVSSRENFVVKADYETGAIKWLFGNPQKTWYGDFPLSLRPLALRLIKGDFPIGQHALSLSADGEYLMLFNNGQGNQTLTDVGDSRTYSKVSIYRIDDEARTAEEVWSCDFGKSIFAPVSSSAYRTAHGNVLVTFARPDDGSPTRIVVVDDAETVLFDASLEGSGPPAHAYAAEEIRLGAMRIE